MSYEKLVSVIIPAYNHENYVEACIEAIASQSHETLELVIINDGSTDRTDEEIKEALAKFPHRFHRVVHLSRENQGTAATLNELIQLSEGEYVFLNASDDLAKPQAVETLLAFLENNEEYALAVGDNEIINQEGARVCWDRHLRNITNEEVCTYKTFGEFLKKRRPEVNFESEEFGSFPSLLVGNYIPNGKLFRKAALLEVGGYAKGMVEDYYMNLLLSKKYKMKYVNQVLFSYRWHDANSIRNKGYMSPLRKNQRRFVIEEIKKARKTGTLTTPLWPLIIKLRARSLLARVGIG